MSTPFISIKDGHHRKVSFDTRDELGNKIDKLVVMIGKLATTKGGTNRQFRPQIHQSRGRGLNRNNSQRNYHNRYRQNNRSNSKDRGFRRIYVLYSTDKIETGLDMKQDMERIIEEVILEGM